MKISNTRAAIIDFIVDGNPQEIAKFLRSSKKLTDDLQEFYGPELYMPILIQSFDSGSKEDIRDIREFLSKYFKGNSHRLPISKIPPVVRRELSMQEAKEEFEAGMHSLTRGSIAKGAFNFSLSALSAAGLVKEERQKVVAGTAAVGMAGMATIALSGKDAPSQHEVLSSLSTFNQQAYSESITSPLRITIESEKISTYEGEYQFSPYLIQKIESSANARQYMTWILDAADKNGLDPVLFGNQLFKESLHFSERVIRGEKDSRAGAKGIAQFIKSTGANYGLHNDEDFYDPQKAIYAAARHMSDLTDDYDGDQILAMVAYNGGPKAVTSAANQLGKTDITGDEWIYAMKIRHAQFGDKDKSAWHVETLEYVQDITGKGWDKDYASWANKLQGDEPLLFVEDKIRSNPAMAAIQAAAPTAPHT
jgi:hypothetical protein